MIRVLASSLLCLALAACGGEALANRTPSASQALTSTAEWLEFQTPAARADLFKEVAKNSIVQAGQPASDQSLFPILLDRGEFLSAPGLDPKLDLLDAPDAGALQLMLDGRGDRWSDDRRDSLQGLSEKEAVELIARSLLHHWGVSPSGAVRVDRAAGAPYAAAYVDGILRINPSFVYLAAAPANLP